MNTPVVKIEGLSHRYTAQWAIKDISFEIDGTGIVGLLGSNGAGKSTTMNILCGVLNQTRGEVFIGGVNMRQNPEKAKSQIGFLPQSAPLYMDFTVDEYLTYCGYLRGIEEAQIDAALASAKERCGLGHYSKRLIRNLSGGYRQRVGIAQAIIHNPKLVVLDEPTNGLDPNQILEVRALIRDIAREKAVIISTHILSEVQVLCEEIKMIDAGKIVFADTMSAFNNYIEPHSLLMDTLNPPTADDLMQIPGVTKVDYLTENQIRLFFNTGQEIIETVIAESVRQGWRLRGINLDKSSLNEVFAQLSNHHPKN